MSRSAHVITLGLDRALNGSIRAWFTQFNFLPPLGLTAARVDTIDSHVSLKHLLEAVTASRQSNFILIVHGHEDGSGLWLRLTEHQGKPHTSHFDLQRLMDLDAGGPAMARADYATLGIGHHEVQTILDLRHQVLDKRIDCIEFRSCNLGRNKLSLDRFRQFFGAQRAGAPDLHTVFGLVPILLGPQMMKNHTHFHSGKGHWETYNFPTAIDDPNLVACFALNDLSKPESGGHIAADSAAILNAWIRRYIKQDGSHKSGEMALHTLWIADRIIPATRKRDKARSVPAAIVMEPEDYNDPLGGYGPRDDIRRSVFPLSENYAKHIIYSP
jgi:hypothetical protein